MDMTCRHKEDIVPRLILLYHGVLQIQGILLRGHYYIAHVCNGADKQVGAQRIVDTVEIRRYPPFQVLGLTYINHRPRGVIVCIDSGVSGRNDIFSLSGRFFVYRQWRTLSIYNQ